MRQTNTGTEWKKPKTVAQAKLEIIESLKWSVENMARLHRTGEYEQFANKKLNPEGKGELSMEGFRTGSRTWQAARQLEAEGVIVVVRGCLDGKTIAPGEFWPRAYVLTGPNFPN